MLKQPLPGVPRAAFGTVFVALLALGSGYAAWAAQPAAQAASENGFVDSDDLLNVTLRRAGVLQLESTVRAEEGKPPAIESGNLVFDYRITEVGADDLELSATLREGSAVLSEPRLRFRRGDVASIEVDGGIAFEFRFDTLAALRDIANVDVTFARLVPPSYPTYPAEAIADRAQGKVMLSILVDAQGVPEQVEVETSSGHASLDQASVEEARAWRFNPFVQNGKPTARWVQVPITFTLTGEEGAAPAEKSPE